MSGWLLDTSVISAFAPEKPRLPTEQAAWFRERADQLFLSTITAMEVESGIAKLRRAGAVNRVEGLRVWFDQILQQYSERVLPFDLSAAKHAGVLNDAAQAAGRHPGFADIAIAAIAQVGGLTVLTVNLRHFRPLGVEASNPFRSD